MLSDDELLVVLLTADNDDDDDDDVLLLLLRVLVVVVVVLVVQLLRTGVARPVKNIAVKFEEINLKFQKFEKVQDLHSITAVIGRHQHSLYCNKYTSNGPLSRTTWVSRYQKGKTSLDFTEARDSERHWHQLDHMQVCTSLQTDNHTSTALKGLYCNKLGC